MGFTLRSSADTCTRSESSSGVITPVSLSSMAAMSESEELVVAGASVAAASVDASGELCAATGAWVGVGAVESPPPRVANMMISTIATTMMPTMRMSAAGDCFFFRRCGGREPGRFA